MGLTVSEAAYKLGVILGEQAGGKRDLEDQHWRADEILLDLIDIPEIRALYEAIDRWYA